MLSNALQFIVETVFNLFAIALLLRFLLQWLRASFRNPFSQFLVALTNFLVLPLRKVIPGLGGLDWASLFAAWLVELVMLLLVLLVGGFPLAVAGFGVFPGIALWAVVKLVSLGVYVFMGAVLIQALLSWVNPYSPIAPLLYALSEPLLRPVRKMLPPVGGVDLSPLVVLLVLQLVLMLPVAWLEMAVLGMFR
ncbi:MAG: YggT family protein [Sulfuricellaceae bacterium]|jgi:YggT family protein